MNVRQRVGGIWANKAVELGKQKRGAEETTAKQQHKTRKTQGHNKQKNKQAKQTHSQQTKRQDKINTKHLNTHK